MDSYDGFFARRQGFRTARQHVYQEGMRTVYSICASSTNRQHRRPLGNCRRIVRRGLIAIAKKAVASKQLVRNIRDGVQIAWIVAAVAAVSIVTGIAYEFQALTVTGLAGLTISLALQTTLSNIIAGVLLFSDKTLRLNDVTSYSGMKAQLPGWV